MQTHSHRQQPAECNVSPRIQNCFDVSYAKCFDQPARQMEEDEMPWLISRASHFSSFGFNKIAAADRESEKIVSSILMNNRFRWWQIWKLPTKIDGRTHTQICGILPSWYKLMGTNLSFQLMFALRPTQIYIPFLPIVPVSLSLSSHSFPSNGITDQQHDIISIKSLLMRLMRKINRGRDGGASEVWVFGCDLFDLCYSSILFLGRKCVIFVGKSQFADK